MVVAIPAMEDILAPASPQYLVVAFAPVEHVIALGAGKEVFARPSVERVLAPLSEGISADRRGAGLQLVRSSEATV